MNYFFHPEAEIELNEAIEYYEDIEDGLGLEFANEIFAAIERACNLPKAWSIIKGEIRRSLVKRFPYGVLYSDEKNQIFIIAIMHLHREPDYWIDRNS